MADMRWTIKPEALVASNGAEVMLGIAYGPVPEVETAVCPVAEMILARGEATGLRRENERLKGEAAAAGHVRESAQEMLDMARSFLRVCRESENGNNPVTRRQAFYELSSACGWMGDALSPASRDKDRADG